MSSDGSEASNRGRRYRLLDAVRGIACLMVIGFHASGVIRSGVPLDRAWERALVAIVGTWHFSVPMFFFVSGYCICASVDQLLEKRISAIEFFARRLRRIFPPYWIFIACALVLYLITRRIGYPISDGDANGPVTPGSLSVGQWIGTLTLIENWRHHIAGGPTRWLYQVAWTLGYEEQFYALVGILLVWAPRALFRGLAVATAVAVLGLLSRLPVLDGFLVDGVAVFFAPGVFVYYVTTYTTGRARRAWIGLMVGLAVALAIFGSRLFVPRMFGWTLGAVIFALLMLALHKYDDVLCRIRLLRPFMWVGTISYSAYLIHPLVIVAIATLAGTRWVKSWSPGFTILGAMAMSCTVVTLLASLFYVLVERRFIGPTRFSVRGASSAQRKAS